VGAVLSVHLRAGHGKRAPGLHYLAARDERAARRGEDVDLVLDGDERGAVDVAFLLGDRVAIGKLDLGMAGLDTSGDYLTFT
jgi:hypothetical protein